MTDLSPPNFGLPRVYRCDTCLSRGVRLYAPHGKLDASSGLTCWPCGVRDCGGDMIRQAIPDGLGGYVSDGLPRKWWLLLPVSHDEERVEPVSAYDRPELVTRRWDAPDDVYSTSNYADAHGPALQWTRDTDTVERRYEPIRIARDGTVRMYGAGFVDAMFRVIGDTSRMTLAWPMVRMGNVEVRASLGTADLDVGVMFCGVSIGRVESNGLVVVRLLDGTYRVLDNGTVEILPESQWTA